MRPSLIPTRATVLRRRPPSTIPMGPGGQRSPLVSAPAPATSRSPAGVRGDDRGRGLEPGAESHIPGVERRSRSRGGQPERVRGQLRLRLSLQEGPPDAQSAQIQELLAGDLSTGGAFIQCQSPPPVGERATVEVCRPGGGVAFAAQGRVVWRRPSADRLGRPAGFGLSFERLDVRDGAAVRGICDLLQRQQALQEAAASDASAPARELALYSLGDLAHNVSDLVHSALPPEIAAFVHGYDQVSDRDGFLWRWAYQGVSVTTLSTVDPRLTDAVSTIKLLAVMFTVLLDDAADRTAASAAPSSLFSSLSQLWLSGVTTPAAAADRPFMAFARRVYEEFTSRVEALGRYGEFADLLHFDKQQLVQAAQYQLLVRRSPHFASEGESRALSTVGIPLTIGATIDLCASPTFDSRETGLLREVLGHASRMAHAAHVLLGWERQLSSGDLGCAVIPYGLASGTLAPSDVDPATGPLRAPRLVPRLKEARVDSHFLTDWLRDRFTLRELSARLRSVDVGQLLSAQQRLMWLQLSSRGLV